MKIHNITPHNCSQFTPITCKHLLDILKNMLISHILHTGEHIYSTIKMEPINNSYAKGSNNICYQDSNQMHEPVGILISARQEPVQRTMDKVGPAPIRCEDQRCRSKLSVEREKTRTEKWD